MKFDVVTFGEAMVLFAPTESALLESAGYFHVSIGGAELNCAIGLARLGYPVSWISRLGDDPFGQKILKTARGEGVDVHRVRLTSDGPTGVMFKEVRPGSASRVFYYRKLSPAAALEVDQFADLQAQILFVTGITPALSPRNRELTTVVVDQFRAAGALIVFDPNMRFRLWSQTEARTVLLELAKRSDVLLPSLVDAEMLCGKGNLEAMVDRLRELGPKRLAIKLGEQGVFFADEKNRSHLPCFPVTEIDPVGAGDAFCAGVISGLLDNVSFPEAVRRGAALGAFGVSSWGDYAGLPTRTELDRFLAGEATQGR
ncbi:MAG TPA: sugar kinase [Chthoniobacterales bacterium]|nr:sugar kinase [Chthoniobacterales bacterium]